MKETAILGFIGALMILIAFVMNQKHKWEEDYLVYDLSNVAGSSLLVWYAYLIDAYPFMLLNGAWAIVSLVDVVKYFMNLRKGGKFEGSTHEMMK
ncbi:MAG: hypothetical protein UR28_C0001G0046 [Candidatus Peregrinibacteria bacterium GW2011_GWF2_33_10]|nr:MAG: hypothetical protein UR28_C0001G0046 [Candidatus Peregrinibacteria bacterium GW2011_GWF2_33_10]OGJ44490.1 MAG: hypothetical protein A2272_00645 [Candidatus Peregrinibacteria bacterium RIFOXYA12_FULL_33_12]OGJ44794.1 MAG: hypothetical protein A2263_06165 [Candidatus Peregrinibacteria bacterium RIFOXYA2_FULL_33_21]OGJ50480.1 MAG: hypothetical protein A2307_02790 [Candidatus Peregrinibacteria bacterium RIFOXYB2_FULL_33_20]